MTNIVDMFETFNRKVQLHQHIELRYYVDHYAAIYYTTDGGREVARGKGETIFAAMIDLESKIRDFDIRHR